MGVWQGTAVKTKTRKRNTNSKRYKAWRLAVVTRDNYTCQVCYKSKGVQLNAHHIIPWAKSVRHRFLIRNGITLCTGCHNLVHS